MRKLIAGEAAEDEDEEQTGECLGQQINRRFCVIYTNVSDETRLQKMLQDTDQ